MKNKINNQAIIDDIEKAQIRTDLPKFNVGDSISVYVKIVEGAKTRVQRIDGLVLRIKGRGLSKSFILRKISSGVGVEETFQINSPLIVKIDITRKGKVRRAYISYMRNRFGKSARIKSSSNTKNKRD